MIDPWTDVPQVKELALTLPFSSLFCFLFSSPAFKNLLGFPLS
jgi:hypothetical protein